MNTQIAVSTPKNGALNRFQRSVLLEETIARSIERVANVQIQNATLIREQFFSRQRKSINTVSDECGYPDQIETEDYCEFFDRFGLATRTVAIYPLESWKGLPEVLENPSGELTAWEKAWNDLDLKHSLIATLINLDILCGIGHYGILIIGINDGKALSDPVDGFENGIPEISKNSTGSTRKLLYLRPLSERVLTVVTYDNNSNSPRFGQPVMYRVNYTDPKNSTTKSQMQNPLIQSYDVHWSRVIHVSDNETDSPIFGTPRMQPVYDYLLNLQKILGGSSEMLWKGGFPGLSVETHPESETVTFSDTEQQAMKEQLKDYMDGLQRYLVSSGISVKSLNVQVADPSKHFDINIKALCSTLGVPVRIFLGTEEAQLAGEQDSDSWNSRLESRRNTFINPRIIRPFVERLMIYGVLPTLEEFQTVWPSLKKTSVTETAQAAKTTTEALATYVSGGVNQVITEQDYLTEIIGMDAKKAEEILSKASGVIESTEEDETSNVP